VSFLIALGLGIVLTPLARRAGLAAGVLDRPDGRELKIHRDAVPLLGGAAVVVAAIAADAIGGDRLHAGLLVAVALGFVPGLVDDVRPLSPWPRLAMQVAAGGALAAGGSRLSVGGAAGVVGVIALTVALTNAVNLVDGQDMLGGGVAALAALGLGGLARVAGYGGSTLAFATAGGLIAFLIWNKPPAKIFLGNGGAYAVGVLLAASAASASVHGARSFLAAAACCGILALELAFTAGRRVISRTPIGVGDRGHSYDLLSVRIGRSKTVAWFLAAQAVAVASAFAIRAIPAGAGASLLSLEVGSAALWAASVTRTHQRIVGTA
jgi:UDP-GlcNAc:undecaprenyl-phosphate/decaprenyl-phosphate GlcNAc-1-phosphate transferase